MWQKNVDENQIKSPHENALSTNINIHRAKKAMQSTVEDGNMRTWNDNVKNLTMQRDFGGNEN